MANDGRIYDCGIYGIRNSINGKWYIGQSKRIRVRKNEHFRKLRSDRHANNKLQHAFTAHGEESFEFFYLESVIESMLDRKKISEARKNISPETRKKLSEAAVRQWEKQKSLGLIKLTGSKEELK